MIISSSSRPQRAEGLFCLITCLLTLDSSRLHLSRKGSAVELKAHSEGKHSRQAGLSRVNKTSLCYLTVMLSCGLGTLLLQLPLVKAVGLGSQVESQFRSSVYCNLRS